MASHSGALKRARHHTVDDAQHAVEATLTSVPARRVPDIDMPFTGHVASDVEQTELSTADRTRHTDSQEPPLTRRRSSAAGDGGVSFHVVPRGVGRDGEHGFLSQAYMTGSDFSDIKPQVTPHTYAAMLANIWCLVPPPSSAVYDIRSGCRCRHLAHKLKLISLLCPCSGRRISRSNSPHSGAIWTSALHARMPSLR